MFKIVDTLWIKIFLLLLFLFQQNRIQAQDKSKISLAKEYLKNGETDKAKLLFKQLTKSNKNIPFIHASYFELLLSQKEYSTAKTYLKRLQKKNPQRVDYALDQIHLQIEQGEKKKGEENLNKLLVKQKSNEYKLRQIGNYLKKNQHYKLSEYAFLKARKQINKNNAFIYDLTNLYILSNQKQKIVDEYLNGLKNGGINLSYVKSILGRIFKDDKDFEMLENKLIQALQVESKPKYSDLLIWLYLQKKDFYSAFIQAKAIEKRASGTGKRIFNVGNIAMNNDDYEMAVEIYEYLTKNFMASSFYSIARRNKIFCKSEVLKNSIEVSENKIRNLIQEYQLLHHDLGNTEQALVGLQDKARLHAFYLNEYDSAIQHLSFILKEPSATLKLKMEVKLDLGDIYLLDEQPWESVLLYAQVEKQMKATPIGYKAKLKNAKLSYYKGEFSLAKEHLDILKQATTRKISNDAMELSLLIKDNTGLDSTESAMKEYAKIDLLFFQNRTKQALVAIDSMLQKYNKHSLTDELLWLRANVYYKTKEYENAEEDLKKIITEFEMDLLTDNAYYLLGNIYEKGLKNKTLAMETYQNLMVKYPESMFTNEARKRFRKLRGDK